MNPDPNSLNYYDNRIYDLSEDIDDDIELRDANRSHVALNMKNDNFRNNNNNTKNMNFVMNGLPYLTNENHTVFGQLLTMNINMNVAYLIIAFSDCKNINEALDFITTDDFGYYNHPFIEDYAQNTKCMICDGSKDKHLDLITKNNQTLVKLNEALSQKKQNDDKVIPLKQSRKSTFSKSSLQKPVFEETPNGNNELKIACSICYTEIFERNTVNFNNASHMICATCFITYLTTEINNNKVLQIKCPHCFEELSDETVKFYVTSIQYEKLKKFRQNHQINSNPLCRWCINPACSQVITLKSNKDLKGKCEHCGTEICPKCNQFYHGKQTCDENVDVGIKKWAQNKDVQNCPKCGMLVEKIQGCNHMTCQVCRYEWCWLCRSAYTSIHFSPLNPLGCPGLQNGVNISQNWGCCKLLLWRLLIFLAILIAYPFCILLGFPVLFTCWIMDSTWYRRRIRYAWFCTKGLFILGVILVGLLLNIIIAPVAIALTIPGLLVLFIWYICERIKLRRRYREAMKIRDQQLISEQRNLRSSVEGDDRRIMLNAPLLDNTH